MYLLVNETHFSVTIWFQSIIRFYTDKFFLEEDAFGRKVTDVLLSVRTLSGQKCHEHFENQQMPVIKLKTIQKYQFKVLHQRYNRQLFACRKTNPKRFFAINLSVGILFSRRGRWSSIFYKKKVIKTVILKSHWFDFFYQSLNQQQLPCWGF